MATAEIVFLVALAALFLLLTWRAAGALRSFWRAVSGAARSGELRRLLAPFLLALLSGVALVAAKRLPVEDGARVDASRLMQVLLGLGITWFVADVLMMFVRATMAGYDITTADNLRARQVHTQYRVLVRISLILVWTIGGAVMLSLFPSVRTLGTGLLTSAGIAGLVIGLAAQRTIGNFLAGIQIAVTQPIRLDDAVVIDGEWGWIEDITTTYVVVKIWDERRLIVPFSRLLEQSFQNWTRTRADLLGSVTLWTDYRVPVAAVRQELNRIVAENELWDGRVVVLQVVEASERAIQLRALVSASSSPRAWDLRCFVREKLIAFLAQEHPYALPTVRAEVESPDRGPEPAPSEQQAELDASPVQPETGGLPGEP